MCITVQYSIERQFIFIKFAESRVRNGTWRPFGNSETIGTLLPHFFVVDILPVHPKFRFLKKI